MADIKKHTAHSSTVSKANMPPLFSRQGAAQIPALQIQSSRKMYKVFFVKIQLEHEGGNGGTLQVRPL